MHRNSRYLLLTCFTSLLACSQNRMSSEETVATIGSSGGFLKSADGKLLLEFPAGVFAANTTVKIATDRGTIRGDLAGPIYRFSPSGVQFSSDVKVSISVAQLPPEGEDYFVANTDSAEPALLEETLFDESTMTVSVGLKHFSSYGLFHRPGRCRNLSCGDSCGQVGRIPLFCNARRRCVPARVLPDDTVIPPSCGAGQDAGPAFDSAFSEFDASIIGGEDGGSFSGDAGDGGLSTISEVEPNDQRPQALFGDRMTIEGTLSPTDVDLYSFDVPSGFQAMLIATTHSAPDALDSCTGGLDTTLSLSSGGSELDSNDDYLPSLGCSRLAPARLLGEGTYVLAVRQFAGSTTVPYFLTVEVILVFGGEDGGPFIGPDASIFPGEDGGPFIGPDASIFPSEDGGPFIGPDASIFPGTDASIFPGTDGGPFIGPDGGISGFDASIGPQDAGAALISVNEQEPNDLTPQRVGLPVVFPLPNVSIVGRSGGSSDTDKFLVDFSSPIPVGVHINVVCSGWDPTMTVETPGGQLIAENDDQSTSNPCPAVTLLGQSGSFVIQLRSFAGGSGGPYAIDLDFF